MLRLITLSRDTRGGIRCAWDSWDWAETIERLAREHAEVGQVLVSATVFGRPDVAAAGRLIVIAAGPAQAVERARPLLDGMGQRVFVLGEEAPHANVVKLTGNFMTSAVIEALAEGLTLVGKAGVDREAFVQVLTEGLFPAPAYKIFGRALLEGRFTPGFPLPLGAKDNRLFLQAGDRHQVPLPLASLVHDRMVAALARGYGDLDWSAFSRIEAEESGERAAPARGA